MAETGRRKAAREAGKRRQMLVLAAALGLLIFACIAVIQLAPTGDVHAARLVNDVPLDTPVVTPPTDTPPAATPTPTRTSRKPTPTATAARTVTPGATATSTAAAAGNGNGGGGGSNGGGDTSSGPQPTKVVLSQPTIGASDNGPLGGFDTTSNGANGVWIASLFGCVSAILGILVAAIALSVLVRGGYGPFLRALALGRRANKGGKAAANNGLPSQASGRLQATNAGGRNAPARDYRDDDELPRRGAGGLWQDDQQYDDYGPFRVWQGHDDRPPPASPRTAPRPRGRSRADW